MSVLGSVGRRGDQRPAIEAALKTPLVRNLKSGGDRDAKAKKRSCNVAQITHHFVFRSRKEISEKEEFCRKIE
jgi:hypothetical protein